MPPKVSNFLGAVQKARGFFFASVIVMSPRWGYRFIPLGRRGARRAGWDSIIILMSPRWGYCDVAPSEAEGWGYWDGAPLGLVDCTPSEAEGWGCIIV